MDNSEVIALLKKAYRNLSEDEKKEFTKTILFEYIDAGMIAEVLEMVVEIEKEIR